MSLIADQFSLERPAFPTGALPPEPARPAPRVRRLKYEKRLVERRRDLCSVEEAREMLRTAIDGYLAGGDYGTALLGALPPGCGKTTIGVLLAERLAAAGRRVLYLGPRTNFWTDVQAIATRKSWWYQWLPRQGGDDEAGKPETCRHWPAMKTWIGRGYKAINLCANAKVCGWDYVQNTCPWHAQKAITQPIVFGQHAHLIAHPLLEQVDVVIGDENPMAAMLWDNGKGWWIPPRAIANGGMAADEPMAELLHDIARLAERGIVVHGVDLLTLLGGPQRVMQATGNIYDMPDETPNVSSAGAVEEVPYYHAVPTARLLYREAERAMQGEPYPSRVILSKAGLGLLLRHEPSKVLAGKPLIWLDGTANARLYQQVLRRPMQVVQPAVRFAGAITQVVNRTNGKGSLVDRATGGLTDGAQQLYQQVRHIVRRSGYQRPAIATYEVIEGLFDMPGTHFYGARGSNAFESSDCFIVAGTPQPAMSDIVRMAAMLYDERMEPFDLTWTDRDIRYVGHHYSYPAAGFWDDGDLQAMLWQYREAELIQMAHRARIVFNPAHVYLLTNLPIDELAPERLMTINELFDAPGGVQNPYRWPDVLALADERYQAGQTITSTDLVERFGVAPGTARKWLDLLVAQQPGRWEPAVQPKKRGRPALAFQPRA